MKYPALVAKVPRSENSQWVGTGVVLYIYSGNPQVVRLRMLTGPMQGHTGTFDAHVLSYKVQSIEEDKFFTHAEAR